VPERNFRVSFCPGRGFPPPRSPPSLAIATTVHCPGIGPREEPDPGQPSPPFSETGVRAAPGTASLRVSAMTALAPRRGRGRSAQRGRGGVAREERMGTHLRRGGNPLPGPHPPWRYPHGPLHGEIPGSNQVQARTPLPPGNQRKDRSRGTAHPRLYARALSPPLPGWGDGESALGMRRRPDIICSFGIDAPASGGAVSSRAQRPIGAERDPAGVHAPTGQVRTPTPIPEAVRSRGEPLRSSPGTGSNGSRAGFQPV